MPSTPSEHSFLYVETDVPDGMTLSARIPDRGRRSGILRRLGKR
jgi:hypothetical protein